MTCSIATRKEIWVAGREGYEEARSFMEMLEPEQMKNVRFYDERTPLFAKMGVESQLDSMLQPQVTLKSGGYLVINQTEALVAIDVNSGKSTKQHSVEDTAYQTNLEAADEIARQLRLRDLAGLIVVDFIDMDERRNNRNVEKRMKDALKNDRARIQVGRISHFGLMEMSRQRMRASVIESATETCPVCAGLGYVRSPSSVSIHVLRGIEEYLLRSQKNDLTVRTRLQTALHILNHKRSSLDDLEARFGVAITIAADETLASHFTIERGEPASARRRVESHVQVDSVQLNAAEADEPLPETATLAVPEPDMEPEADEPEEGNGKRRRRGRRGGRKAKSEDTAPEEAGADTGDQADTGDEADGAQPTAEAAGTDDPGAAADHETESSNVESEVEAKPKRRRRRAAKTDEVDEAKEFVAEPSASASTGERETSEPPRPKRRPTSRPRRREAAAEAVGDTAVHATSDAIMNGVVGETIEAEPAENGSDEIAQPARPPRRRTSRSRKAKDEEGGGEAAESSDEAPTEKKGWLKRTFFPD